MASVLEASAVASVGPSEETVMVSVAALSCREALVSLSPGVTEGADSASSRVVPEEPGAAVETVDSLLREEETTGEVPSAGPESARTEEDRVSCPELVVPTLVAAGFVERGMASVCVEASEGARISAVVSLQLGGEWAPGPELVPSMCGVCSGPEVRSEAAGEGEGRALAGAVGGTGEGEAVAGTDGGGGDERLCSTDGGLVPDTSWGPGLRRVVPSACVTLGVGAEGVPAREAVVDVCKGLVPCDVAPGAPVCVLRMLSAGAVLNEEVESPGVPVRMSGVVVG